MHELSIAQSILEITKQEVQRRNIHRAVEKVVFCAGRLNAIVSGSLTFYFDELKKDDSQLQKAALEIQILPIQATCKNCKNSYKLDEPNFVCTNCGGALEMKSGQEMYIGSLVIEDEPEEPSVGEPEGHP